jgi:hypothetical protein
MKLRLRVTYLRTAVLSIITGGGKWVEITVPMDPLYLRACEAFGCGGFFRWC